MEWARDSAFRFFPLMEHEQRGLTLHPFDLATNKVLALVGRLEVRDWVDVINADRRLQPLGYLLWAACGKDPGVSPGSLLAHARRTTRYSALEVAQLDFRGAVPDAGELARTWRGLLEHASSVIDLLPAEEAGRCVLDAQGNLCTCSPARLPEAVDRRRVRFHPGSLGGAYRDSQPDRAVAGAYRRNPQPTAQGAPRRGHRAEPERRERRRTMRSTARSGLRYTESPR